MLVDIKGEDNSEQSVVLLLQSWKTQTTTVTYTCFYTKI